jgi:hypothetical protein
MLPPALAYELWLTGEGAEPSDRHSPVLSHYIGWCSLRLPSRGARGGGGVRPLILVICFGVDHPGPWWTGFFMGHPAFNGASLSDVGVIMAILHILMELICQAMMGHILALQCMFPQAHVGACGQVLSSSKWLHCSRTPALGSLVQYLGYPWAWLPGARAYAEPGCEDKSARVDRW